MITNKAEIAVCLLCLALGGCLQKTSSMLSLRYSEKPYRLVMVGSNHGEYEPEPDEVVSIAATVLQTTRPKVDSRSISQEKTETIFSLKKSIPKKGKQKKLQLFHWTYFLDTPLKAGDTVTFLFDAKGNLIDVV